MKSITDIRGLITVGTRILGPEKIGEALAKHFSDNYVEILQDPHQEVGYDLKRLPPTLFTSELFASFCSAVYNGRDGVFDLVDEIKWETNHSFESEKIKMWIDSFRESISVNQKVVSSSNLVDRLSCCEKEYDSLMRQLRVCPVWKAIQKYIEDTKDENCFLNYRDGLVYHRGTGPFYMKKVYAYPPATIDLPYPAVRFSFDVSTWDGKFEEEFTENVLVDVPAELVDRFDEKKFDDFIKEKHKESLRDKEEEAEKKLLTFFKNNPALAKKWKKIDG